MAILSVHVISFLLVLFLSCQVDGQRVCNNAASLCTRKYNQITHLGAHDSPFLRNPKNGYTPAGDQFYSSLSQLDAGVRMLTAQVHRVTNEQGQVEWRLCHTDCALYDAGLFSVWLARMRGWLDTHPNDVVTILIVNSDGASAETLHAQFTKAQMAHYGYVPPVRTAPTNNWPTLNTMINNNKRLVVFIASLDPRSNTVAPYLLDQFTFTFENDYDNTSPTDYSCTANRPSSFAGRTDAALASGRMPIMNHFLYDTFADGAIEVSAPEKSDNTNAPGQQTGMLGLAATRCTAVYKKPPTFILVDFFNVGPALATVDRLNKVTGQAKGRTKLPTTYQGTMDDLNSGGAGSNVHSAKVGSSTGSGETPQGTGAAGGEGGGRQTASNPSSASSGGGGSGSSNTQDDGAGGIGAGRWKVIQSLALVAGLSTFCIW